jgi:DNA-binding winged helix-turn-helix (wHTH) protein/TolB-like protein
MKTDAADRIAAPSSIPQAPLIALRPRSADHRPLCCDAVNRRPGVLRFGDYEFRPDTGDLRRLSPPPPGTAVRLAPQPAKLLELLLERRGELLERDEIRRVLWSDTHVDFDQSLAFCVRQLRAALGDSGAKPAYIETLPRRGFRLVAPVVETVVEPAAESAVVVEQKNTAGPASIGLGRAGWSIAILLLVVATAIGAHLARREPRVVTRLAIMPFELAAGVEEPEDRSRLALISESLMVDLARDGDAGIEVIGPRTTAEYHGSPFPDLDALANDLEINYVLNGRYLEARGAESPPVLIVELIRLEDRAHPWVERFDGERSPQEIAATVRDGVRLAIAPSR